MIEKPQHPTGTPNVPNEMKKASEVKKTKIIPQYDKKVKIIGDGFDISNVPKKMRIEGQVKAKDRVNPHQVPEGADMTETADVVEKSASTLDRPRYHSIDVEETDDGFLISSYNPQIKKVAKTRDEMMTAIQEILDTPTKEDD